ncbi:putative entry exclusion protein TrbK-alt [Paracoccus onubensis]|uniref:putative entry exclusion protein TrbK-alt n=1 Tax=Paracoccus onubensis TaxID=1675788 RepID=UPI00273191CB|nr:putative entry exclusion protein TrbK-alt [Paracoccus onubensis]MDP0929401.1 putative entry exclusion protein TrbK-alt [Paracoccus onubensis]
MDGKMLARLGAVVFVAISLTVTAIDMARKDEPPTPPPAPAFQPSPDPLRETLRRCQQLGEAAASDADCLAAWAESRDRFLGRDRSEAR